MVTDTHFSIIKKIIVYLDDILVMILEILNGESEHHKLVIDVRFRDGG